MPEYGLPWVPANTNPELAAYSNGQPPVDSSNFYGLTTRDYEKHVNGRHHGAARPSRQPVADVAESHALRAQRPRFGDHLAPICRASTPALTINRQLQSRDMVDTIVANQTSAIARFGTGRSVMP